MPNILGCDKKITFMIRFFETLEIIRNRGIVIVDNKGYVPVPPHFYDVFEQCQPFVFAPLPELKVTDLRISSEPSTFDAPFKVFSLETLDDSALVIVQNIDGSEYAIFCVIVNEYEPMKFEFFCLVSPREISSKKHVMYVSEKATDWFGSKLCKDYLSLINKEKIGIKNIRKKIKIGTGKSKRFATFKRIVYVVPKKSQIDNQSHTFKSVEWGHRWFVRGHWRKSEGVGKDRSGNYIIKGFTWVSEYEKGPENMPLISKTRIVRT